MRKGRGIISFITVLSIFTLSFSLVGTVLFEKAGFYGKSAVEIKHMIDDKTVANICNRILSVMDKDSYPESELKEAADPNLSYALIQVVGWKGVNVGIDPYFLEPDYVTSSNIKMVVYETDDFDYKDYKMVVRSRYGDHRYHLDSLMSVMINDTEEKGGSYFEKLFTAKESGDVQLYRKVSDEKVIYLLYKVRSPLIETKSTNLFRQSAIAASIIYGFTMVSSILIVVSAFLAVVLLMYLMLTIPEKEQKRNRVFLIFPLLIAGAVLFVLYRLSGLVISSHLDIVTMMVIIGALLLVASGTVFMVFMNIGERIRCGGLLHNTLFLFIIRKLYGGLLYLKAQLEENVSITVKLTVFYGILTVIQFGVLYIFSVSSLIGTTAAIFYKIIAIIVVVYLIGQISRILDGMNRIVKGDLNHHIVTDKMLPDLRKHAEHINNVGSGMTAAVAQRMRSEKMKTELITNVTHDIKTPLTSIINYVDLLGKKETEDEETKEYIDVLKRQSQKLKKLTDDLLEASKASSGNIDVNLEKIDLSVMISQAVGEFEERFSKKDLKLVTSIPDVPCFARADGDHLWRIIDNLMNNIYKYAMAGTRVYLDLKDDEEKAVMTFRNISEYPLNVSADELTERFVRGDKSRSSEGSGLGLSIAISLARLMNGDLDITVDGDLFKAVLTLPLLGSSSN